MESVELPDLAPDEVAKIYLPHGPPLFTKAGFRHGLVFSIPYSLGLAVFGLTAGVLAQKAGLSLFEAILMSGAVFAGASQLAVLSHWPDMWAFSVLLAAVLLVLTINSRFILMGASLYPYLRHLKGPAPWGLLFINTDFLWILFLRDAAIAKEEKRRPDLGFFLGFGLVMWVIWVLVTIPGWYIGSSIADLKKYALDLFALLFFASLLVPMWKGVAHARPWMVAAVVAAIAYFILPGSYYIVIGALAGAAAGALLKS
ncbi:MAG: AzlC family ABC transporter permease [Pseudomonadota bacterium]